MFPCLGDLVQSRGEVTAGPDEPTENTGAAAVPSP